MVIHMHETRKKYTVLLLSAPIGSGHRLAAEALEQAFADRPEVEVIHGNIFDFFPQFLGKAFLGTYLWILKCCPWLYKLAYSWGNKQGGSLWLRELLNRLLAWLGGSYLRSVQPDAVIATHATPAGIIGYYKKQHPKLWLGAVVTDFTIHRWWVCDGVDTYFIALTGVQELVAGVSLVAPMFTLMIAFGDIFGLGGSSAISRLLGEKKDNEAKKTCAFCIWISLVFGLCISAILLLFRTQILGLLGVGKDTYQYANAYYTWIAIGAVSIIFSMVPSNILRTEGLAVQSMAGSIIGSIVNIIFDPIFIFGLNQGAAGAAMATVLGNIIADIYYVYAVMKKSKRLTCSPSHMKVTGRKIRDILMIGIPASITNIMQTFMMVMTNNFLLTYGTDKVAAMGIALKVNMITALVLVGFAFGGQPLVGYNYGAKNEKRLKNILKFAYLFEMGLGLLFTILMCIFAPQIIKVFMDKPDIITNGAMMLRFQQIGMTFMSVSLISTCVCQAVGNAGGAFVLSISRQGVIYVLALFIMSNVFGYTGVLVSQACSDVVTALIAAVIMLKIMKKLTNKNE